jgi:quercetin dioxygenase-like cupin family protein
MPAQLCKERAMCKHYRSLLGVGSLLGVIGCAAVAVITGWVAAPGLEARAQPSAGFAGNKVTPLVQADLTDVPNRQVIANLYEVPAGAMVPRHFHHGDEFHLVISGAWEAEVEGKPAHVMKAGDSQYVRREQWHGGRVVSAEPMRLLGVMIVDKDRPVIEMKR